MQTIVTRYYPPTSTKPAKVKATTSAGTVSRTWSVHKLDGEDWEANHRIAAEWLARELKWTGVRYGGPIDKQASTWAWVQPGHPANEFTT